MYSNPVQTYRKDDNSHLHGGYRQPKVANAGFPSRTLVHAKLEMTVSGDADEREAETMASDIISGGKVRREVSSGFGGGSGIAVSPQMESQLSQLQGGGHAMPDGLRSMMENGFGRDFSRVRLHTDAQAADMSSSIHAKAFTLGNDIYFNRGQFSPSSTEGQRLLAHELTHVAQGTGKVGRQEKKSADEELTICKPYNGHADVGETADRVIQNLIKIAGLLSDVDTLVDFGYTCKEFSTLLDKVPFKTPKGFTIIDSIMTPVALYGNICDVDNDIIMIKRGNNEYYAKLVLDAVTMLGNFVTWPPVSILLEKTMPGLAKYIIAIGAGWTAGVYSVDLVKNAAPYAAENTRTQMESGDLKSWKAGQWGF